MNGNPAFQEERREERIGGRVETSFKCGLFDDPDIPLEDIFYRAFQE